MAIRDFTAEQIEEEKQKAARKERERCIEIVRQYGDVVPAARLVCGRIIDFLKR